MNPGQLARQIRFALQNLEWSQGARVFGPEDLVVFAGDTPPASAIPTRMPCVLIGIGTREHDQDHPEWIQQTFQVLTLQLAFGDRFGESVVLGSNRADLANSAGAGLEEIGSKVRDGLQDLTGADGASVLITATSNTASAVMENGRHVAYERLEFQAACTSQELYAVPQNLVQNGSVWSWTGSHCSTRYDFVQFHLGYVTGSEPAAAYSDLEGIIYSGTAPTVDVAAPSGRTYSVFAEYNPRGDGARAHSRGDILGAFRVR